MSKRTKTIGIDTPIPHQHDLGEEGKAAALRRLRRIEGQVRGLQKMIEDGKPCGNVLDQASAVQSALRAVGRELLEHHMRESTGPALAHGEEDAEAATRELLDLLDKYRP